MADRILQALRNQGPERKALRYGDVELSYHELDRWSAEVAASLEVNSHSQPVGIFAPASLEYAAALIGIWKVGAIAVPLQPAHPEVELSYIAEDTEMSIILVHPELLERAKLIFQKARFIEIARSNLAIEATRTQPQALPNDGALIIYTSGTTSRPKGVLTTREGLDAQVRSLLEAWEWSAIDRTLNILPLHHVHGVVNILCCSLAAGAQCELARSFEPSSVWQKIAAREINLFMAVPTIYVRLIEAWKMQSPQVQSEWSKRAGEMRLMVSGSAALPRPVFEAWEQIAGHRLLERYGMTEIGMALSNPYRGERRAQTVGLPLPGVEVKIEEAGGELLVRGPSVFREYWRRPEATRESFVDGWFRTGDIVERDEKGYYKILGRSSQDIIKTGGYKVSALEIESALLESSLVREVAVIGVSDDEWGERVVAFCVLSSDQKMEVEKSLREFAKSQLAHYKVPTIWRFIASLPRNAMGKVQKPELRKLLK